MIAPEFTNLVEDRELAYCIMSYLLQYHYFLRLIMVSKISLEIHQK